MMQYAVMPEGARLGLDEMQDEGQQQDLAARMEGIVPELLSLEFVVWLCLRVGLPEVRQKLDCLLFGLHLLGCVRQKQHC